MRGKAADAGSSELPTPAYHVTLGVDPKVFAAAPIIKQPSCLRAFRIIGGRHMSKVKAFPKSKNELPPLEHPEPEHWLMRNDDVLIPMQIAIDRLRLFEELLDEFAKSDDGDGTLSSSSWSLLAEGAIEARMELEQARERIYAIPHDVLVSDARFDGLLPVMQLWELRKQREAAQKAEVR